MFAMRARLMTTKLGPPPSLLQALREGVRLVKRESRFVVSLIGREPPVSCAVFCGAGRVRFPSVRGFRERPGGEVVEVGYGSDYFALYECEQRRHALAQATR